MFKNVCMQKWFGIAQTWETRGVYSDSSNLLYLLSLSRPWFRAIDLVSSRVRCTTTTMYCSAAQNAHQQCSSIPGISPPSPTTTQGQTPWVDSPHSHILQNILENLFCRSTYIYSEWVCVIYNYSNHEKMYKKDHLLVRTIQFFFLESSSWSSWWRPSLSSCCWKNER